MTLNQWTNDPVLNEWYYSFKDADGLEWTINLIPWYESQDFYRTVADQQADRLKFGETLTMPEVARLLGTHRNNVYYLVQKGCFETIQTSRTKLICKDSFERWYEGQSKYRIVSAANGGDEDGIHC